jgi:hypothetical protein
MSTWLVVLGAVLGAGGGLLGGWQASRSASKREHAAHEHERQMAREAADQERLERTYIELGTYLSRYADWAEAVQPMWGSPTPPDPLPPGDRWRLETLFMLHASPEVKRLLDQWREHAATIDNADKVIKTAERARDHESSIHDDANREMLAIPGYRTAMRQADLAIRDQMYSELHEHTAPPALEGKQRPSITQAMAAPGDDQGGGGSSG